MNALPSVPAASLPETPCDHTTTVYARRLNGLAIQICIQCLTCHRLVRLEKHGYRPFLHINEVPAEQPIYGWSQPTTGEV